MFSLAALGRVWAEARRSARLLEERIERALKAGNPALASMYGCGPISAVMLAMAAGDNPERMGSEASFAALCGVSPIRASSDKVERHRLNRGGNRVPSIVFRTFVSQGPVPVAGASSVS